MKKIGILKCGHAPEELVNEHGHYGDMFEDMLGADFDTQVWSVVDNQLPESIKDADGWLITGSRHGVYEDHAWLAPLEQFLREAFAAKQPIVGVCFGHQVLAQALGGKVEQFEGGWSVGNVQYQLDGWEGGARIHAYHQDQVIEPPAEAVTLGSTDFCAHAFLGYGEHAFTMQPHPEFSDAFLRELVLTRGSKSLPPEIHAAALNSVDNTLDSPDMARCIVAFFHQPGMQAFRRDDLVDAAAPSG